MYGFPVVVSGTFDAATTAALSQFQASRKSARQGGSVVDEDTWHLLATGCNAYLDTEAYWFDAGWCESVFCCVVLLHRVR